VKPWLAVACALSLACSSVSTLPRSALSPEVVVTDRDGWIILGPRSVPTRSVGLVFYPGGLVSPEAYLKALSPLAADGWTVAVPRMPFDLAFFDAEKGLQVRRIVPGVGRWAVGGHSLGGVASALAVKKDPRFFSGLVFFASYAPDSADLSALSLPVLSISGTADGLSTPAKIRAADHLLPTGTEHLVLEGGNHAQFADYGPQRSDGTATLTRDEQQRQVADAVRIFLEKLEANP